MKNTSLIDPSRCGIVKNNQGAYVSKNEAYALAQTVKDMFVAILWLDPIPKIDA